jgi:hypothetical protein
VLRAQALDRMRGYYEHVCRERLGWQLPPRESFNQWVWQMQAQAVAAGDAAAPPDPVLALVPVPDAREEQAAAAPASASDGRSAPPPGVVAVPLWRQLMDVCAMPLRSAPSRGD